jgi:hypothetical protein
MELFELQRIKSHIDEGTNIQIQNEKHLTLLHLACMYEPPLVPLLVEHGADVNAVTIRGNRPLHTACRYAHSVVEYLVNHGADVNAITEEGWIPIHLACIFEAPETVIHCLYVRSNKVPVGWPSLDKIIALYSGMCWKRSEVGGLPSCLMTSYIYQDK